jgi:sugar phosphate isomerase/epimerase
MGVAGWSLVGAVVLGQDHASLRAGATVPLGQGTVTIQRMEALPYVQSEFTRRFRFDSFNNPKLKELRERYQLDAVVAPGQDEFERQVLLLDWVHHRFKKFGRPSSEARGALEILRAIDEGHAFFCSHYAHVFVSAAASLGWIDRELALRRHQDAPQGGSTEHSPTEIWSNQYRKWVMMDPTAHMYIEKNGTPLNAYEIRQEWFYREGRDLVFVVGKERKKYRKSDLPIFLGRFEGFGDLTVPADELDKYGFIGYIPNTDLMDAGLDYGQMFIVKDKLCEGTRWHQRTVPAHPARDPYFPINQAAVRLVPEQDQLRVTLQTLTPNFRAYEARIDGGAWRSCGESLPWNLHPGSNRLEVRTVNQFGVEGPISAVESLLTTAEASASPDKHPFFPFCIDWHDAEKRSFEQQAQMLKELGYPGVGHIWLDKVEERIQTLDAAGLKLFQITMIVEVAPGETPYDANRFQAVCAAIQGRGVQFCLLLNGSKPSDPTVDPRAVDILRAMSDQARDSGAQLLLYPHQNSWVERLEDAIRVADKVDRLNVGVMFNLCHWLRVDPSRDYRPLLKRAMPRLWAVSINGADEFDEKPGWDRYIQPLDQGSFDVGQLLRTLKELGYQGPIGLQCYGIGGDAREHLVNSLTAWRKLSENLKD